MFNFNKKNINNVINEFYKSKNEYKENIKQQKGINKITKRIPNFLTKSRFISPFFILSTTLTGNYILSLVFISLFALTDMLDGLCARKFDACSEYGRKLDAISDKIFSIGIGLPILFINPTLVISTLILEILIGFVNVNSELKNNKPHSTKLGKIKTWLTFISLINCYAIGIFKIPNSIIKSVLIITNITQFTTLNQYIYLNKKQSKINHKIDTNLKQNDFNEASSKHSKDVDLENTLAKEIEEYKKLKQNLLEIKNCKAKENEQKNKTITKKFK